MAKINTSELTGAALDWAVANAEGKTLHYFVDDPDKKDPWLCVSGIVDQPLHSYTPSADWAQGGPIIERETIVIDFGHGLRSDKWRASTSTTGYNFFKRHTEDGETPLIASMRCYVASKLGDEVDVPVELL